MEIKNITSTKCSLFFFAFSWEPPTSPAGLPKSKKPHVRRLLEFFALDLCPVVAGWFADHGRFQISVKHKPGGLASSFLHELNPKERDGRMRSFHKGRAAVWFLNQDLIVSHFGQLYARYAPGPLKCGSSLALLGNRSYISSRPPCPASSPSLQRSFKANLF